MQALQHDVSSMKDVLQSRITTTEEGLVATQEKLTSELQATKAAPMHELMLFQVSFMIPGPGELLQVSLVLL